jgi:hypothetical protein
MLICGVHCPLTELGNAIYWSVHCLYTRIVRFVSLAVGAQLVAAVAALPTVSLR